MKDQDLDKLFADKLANAELEAPNMVWDEIEKKLDASQSKAIVKPFWNWRSLSVAASLLLICGLGIGILMHNRQDKITIQNIQIAQSREPAGINKQESHIIRERETVADIPRQSIPSVHPDKARNSVVKSENQPLEEMTDVLSDSEEEIKPELISIIKLEEPEMRVIELPKEQQLAVKLDIDEPKFTELPESVHGSQSTDLVVQHNAGKTKQGLFVKLLNNLTDNILTNDREKLHFSNDEEGTIKISLVNTIFRN